MKLQQLAEALDAQILKGDVVGAFAAFAADRIARFKVPVRFYAVERFPLTPSGKIRKVELREMARDARLTLLA